MSHRALSQRAAPCAAPMSIAAGTSAPMAGWAGRARRRAAGRVREFQAGGLDRNLGRLLATGHGAKTVQVWDTVAQRRAGPALFGHTDRVTSVAFSPDGRLLATESEDATTRLWDVESRTVVAEPLHSTGFVDSLLFAPDGQYHYVQERTIRRWDITDPRQPRKTEKHFVNNPTCAQPSPPKPC